MSQYGPRIQKFGPETGYGPCWDLRQRFRRKPTVYMKFEEIVSLIEYHGQTLQRDDILDLDRAEKAIRHLGRDLVEMARQLRDM
jgi:hypothetical protein